MKEFIIYAGPIGQFDNQLEQYFITTSVKCGKNAAHQYMPHCTLTGFFSWQINCSSDLYSSLRYCLKKGSAESPTASYTCCRYGIKRRVSLS